MKKERIYDIIFFVSLGLLLIWIILKLIGLIKSPFYVEVIPFLSIAFGAGAAYGRLIDLSKRMNKVENRVDKMAHGLTNLEIGFEHFKKRI